jgi:hypothetical protein
MNSKEWYSKNQANFSIGEDTQTLAQTRHVFFILTLLHLSHLLTLASNTFSHVTNDVSIVTFQTKCCTLKTFSNTGNTFF